MKLTNKTLTWMVAGVVSIVLVVGANAQTTKERTGKVVRIKGAARYSMGNKVWQPLKVGTILKAGSVVQTAADSYADIVLNEETTAETVSMPRPAASPTALIPSGGSGGGNQVSAHDVVRVQSDSVMAIDKVSATDTGADRVTETELDLRTGSIFFSVKKQAAASRFEIKLANGIAGIRGTSGIAYSDGRIVCGSGSVVTASTDPAGKVTTTVVPAGSASGPGGAVRLASPAESASVNFLSQDTSYGGGVTGTGAEIINVQNRGREAVTPSLP